MTPVGFFPGKTDAAPAVASRAETEHDAKQAFDDILVGVTRDDAREEGAATVATPEAEEGSHLPNESPEQPRNEEKSDGVNESDAAVLSSCLAMWQVLPPPSPDAAEPASPKGEWSVEGENISAVAGPADGAVDACDEAGGKPATTAQRDSRGPNFPAECETQNAASEAAPDAAQPPQNVAVYTDSAPDAEPMPAIRAASPEAQAETGPVRPVRAKVEPPHALRALRAARPDRNEGSQAVVASAEDARGERDGIPVAKQQRAMSDPDFHPAASRAPAAFAEGEVLPKAERISTAQGAGAVGVDAAEAFGDSTRHEDGETPNGHAEPELSLLGTGHEPALRAESKAATEKASVTDATQALLHVERAIERLRTHDGQRIELRLSLQSGEEVIVKLRLDRGEVKVTFQSGSEGLRHALESGWSQLSQSSADRTVRLGPAVFDAAPLQNGGGGFQQSPRQQGGDSQSQFNEPSAFFAGLRNERKAQPEVRRRVPAPAATANLELYA